MKKILPLILLSAISAFGAAGDVILKQINPAGTALTDRVLPLPAPLTDRIYGLSSSGQQPAQFAIGSGLVITGSFPGTLVLSSTSSGTVGPGTVNRLAKFTSSTVVGDSIFSDNGSTGLIQSSITGGSSVFAIQNTAAAGLSVMEFRNNSGTVKSTFGFGNPSVSSPLTGNQFLYTAAGVDFIFYTNAFDAGRITSTRNFLWGTSSDPGGSGNMSVGGALTLGTPLSRSNGGTGFTSYTEGDLIYGNAGGGLSKLAIQPLPGYVLSSGATPSWQAISSLAVTSITGTANEIAASASVGPVTLSLPTALTFTGKTVTGGTFNATFNGTIGVTTQYIGRFEELSSNTSIQFGQGGVFVAGSIYSDGNWGMILRAKTASPGIADFLFADAAGASLAKITATGINDTAIGATTKSTGAFTAVTVGSTTLLTTSVSLTNGAGGSIGTLTNAPVAGNPTKWIPIVDNGVTRYLPAF